MNKGRRAFLQGAAIAGAGLVAARDASGIPQQKMDDMKDMPGMEHGPHPASAGKTRATNSGVVVPM